MKSEEVPVPKLPAVPGAPGEGEVLTAVMSEQDVLSDTWYKYMCTCTDSHLKGSI